jgi:LDH2 family malate/lactate/ureidoglycolate dehydrogenase
MGGHVGPPVQGCQFGLDHRRHVRLQRMPDSDGVLVESEALRAFTLAVFAKLGVTPEHASVWADALIETSLRGIDSHGILVLPIYASMIEAGGVRLDSRTETVADTGATVLLDGGFGIGFVVAETAMNLALDRAGQFGLSFVSVRNSNHFGTAAYYVMKSLPKDMIGFALTNASPALPAWGGKTRVIGSNAMGVAIPAGEELPIVFDAAIGEAAGAKIFLKAQKGEPIPSDWILDKQGNPTEDPKALMDGGMILPFGKHKGYGIGMILDVLTGVISGGLFSTFISDFGRNLSEPLGVCHSFAALDIRRFIPVPEFKSRIDQMIRNIKRSETREGVDQVYLPGERAFLTYRQRQQTGIPVHSRLIADLRALAQKLSLEPPAGL